MAPPSFRMTKPVPDESENHHFVRYNKTGGFGISGATCFRFQKLSDGMRLIIRAECIDGGGVVLFAGAEDCGTGEVGMVGIIGAVLGFKAEA